MCQAVDLPAEKRCAALQFLEDSSGRGCRIERHNEVFDCRRPRRVAQPAWKILTVSTSRHAAATPAAKRKDESVEDDRTFGSNLPSDFHGLPELCISFSPPSAPSALSLTRLPCFSGILSTLPHARMLWSSSVKPAILGLLLTSLAGFSSCAEGSPRDCALKNLAIEPLNPGRTDKFAGSGKDVRVEFTNYRTRTPVRVFPEPPLTVRHVPANTSCNIDGGVWARDSVFLSSDEALLLVLEFSGDSNELVAYDTNSCRKLTTVDVSNARWLVKGSTIVVATGCTSKDINACRNKKLVPMDTFCGPGKEHK